MPTVSRSRSIPAPPDRVWSLLADPHNLPRWWPGTVRVEDVEGRPGARRSRFTQVLSTRKGKPVRADYRCVESTEGRRLLWAQQLEGTPFAEFLRESSIEVRLAGRGDATEVTIEGRRRLRGLSRLGAPMMRRATGRTLEEVLAEIEAVVGGTAEPGGNGLEAPAERDGTA